MRTKIKELNFNGGKGGIRTRAHKATKQNNRLLLLYIFILHIVNNGLKCTYLYLTWSLSD